MNNRTHNDWKGTGMMMFYSLCTSRIGTYADTMGRPEKLEVEMPISTWQAIQSVMRNIPFSVQSLDIKKLADTTCLFMDECGEFVDLDDFDDFDDYLAFYCYRLKLSANGETTLHIVLSARYHDTFVEYTLAPKELENTLTKCPSTITNYGVFYQEREASSVSALSGSTT